MFLDVSVFREELVVQAFPFVEVYISFSCNAIVLRDHP
jgi:hypothetical protein